MLAHEFATHSQDNEGLGFILWRRKGGGHKLTPEEEKRGTSLALPHCFTVTHPIPQDENSHKKSLNSIKSLHL